jgi:5-methyltetrahydrofolate--homocysteine methyltransferase
VARTILGAMSVAGVSPLLHALADRVLIADSAMGTMLQAADLSLDDFAGLEGCNEILNVTRPDVVADIHRANLAAGADAIETNTFGTNLANLAEYDIPERIRELAEHGALIARAAADEYATALACSRSCAVSTRTASTPPTSRPATQSW